MIFWHNDNIIKWCYNTPTIQLITYRLRHSEQGEFPIEGYYTYYSWFHQHNLDIRDSCCIAALDSYNCNQYLSSTEIDQHHTELETEEKKETIFDFNTMDKITLFFIGCHKDWALYHRYSCPSWKSCQENPNVYRQTFMDLKHNWIIGHCTTFKETIW